MTAADPHRTEASGERVSGPVAGSAAFDPTPFEALARELVERDMEWSSRLPKVRCALEELRERAARAIGTFIETAGGLGARHLVDVSVTGVEPDEKHVDCVQFKVRRGRHEIVCVGKARGAVLLVGPYRQGKPEGPCQEHPLPGDDARHALDRLLVQFLREATQV